MTVDDFDLECYLPEPTGSYFDPSNEVFGELTTLQKVQHLAFCVANGFKMEKWIDALIEDYKDPNWLKQRIKFVLMDYIVFLRVHGDEESEAYDDTYKTLSQWVEQTHSGIKSLVSIFESELNSYVHWKLDRGNITFEDKLEIKF